PRHARTKQAKALLGGAAVLGARRRPRRTKKSGELRRRPRSSPREWLGPSSVPIQVGLVRSFDGDAEILRLLLAQRVELHSELGQVQARHLLVELLRQEVDAERDLLREERDLREHLI